MLWELGNQIYPEPSSSGSAGRGILFTAYSTLAILIKSRMFLEGRLIFVKRI
jgi:hypothetical protein